MINAAISFILKHPPGQTPRHNLKEAKTLPQDNHCVQKPFLGDETGSQQLHPLDIKLENFSNVFHTIWIEKLCVLNK